MMAGDDDMHPPPHTHHTHTHTHTHARARAHIHTQCYELCKRRPTPKLNPKS